MGVTHLDSLFIPLTEVKFDNDFVFLTAAPRTVVAGSLDSAPDNPFTISRAITVAPLGDSDFAGLQVFTGGNNAEPVETGHNETVVMPRFTPHATAVLDVGVFDSVSGPGTDHAEPASSPVLGLTVGDRVTGTAAPAAPPTSATASPKFREDRGIETVALAAEPTSDTSFNQVFSEAEPPRLETGTSGSDSISDVMHPSHFGSEIGTTKPRRNAGIYVDRSSTEEQDFGRDFSQDIAYTIHPSGTTEAAPRKTRAVTVRFDGDLIGNLRALKNILVRSVKQKVGIDPHILDEVHSPGQDSLRLWSPQADSITTSRNNSDAQDFENNGAGQWAAPESAEILGSQFSTDYQHQHEGGAIEVTMVVDTTQQAYETQLSAVIASNLDRNGLLPVPVPPHAQPLFPELARSVAFEMAEQHSVSAAREAEQAMHRHRAGALQICLTALEGPSAQLRETSAHSRISSAGATSVEVATAIKAAAIAAALAGAPDEQPIGLQEPAEDDQQAAHATTFAQWPLLATAVASYLLVDRRTQNVARTEATPSRPGRDGMAQK